MSLVLDAGALVSFERNDRAMWVRLKTALVDGTEVVTHGGIIGQVWRAGGPRQMLLARAIASVDVRPLDEALGRAAGCLLARTRGRDVLDAAVAALARSGDVILTSDTRDLEPLVSATGNQIDILAV
jgi:hypothetical protein